VPEMQLVKERPTLSKFAQNLGAEKIQASWTKQRSRPKDFQSSSS
jgi:hypothetical protein